MAELEDVTLDGRPLDSLRVTDLRTALEERGLPKSGQKSTLMKRLKGALMLENLQKHSTPHTGYQPNSQMGEEMGQNSFIKQYLEKQQELLRQRLQKEAREAQETEEKSNSVLEDPEESEEELPKKRERRSRSRVKQAKVCKPSVFTQPVQQEQEPRRSSTRVRKSAAREEEVEEVDEEEEEEMEEEKQLAVEKDEEETPKRRRSSRTTVALLPKKSPKLKRSPSPPELLETVSKAATLEGEEISEERVPPMLSLEGIHKQSSEKQVSPVSEKNSSPRLLIKESPKSQRSPQKWKRQTRERLETGADAALQQAPVSTSVAPSEERAEKLEIKPQNSQMCEDTKSTSMVRSGASPAKDKKVRSSLVLLKPPVRSKSEGTSAVCTQSLQIVKKLSSRGVQAMSILEKQDREPCSDVKESQSLLSSPEFGRSSMKSKSVYEKSDVSSLYVSGSNESEKTNLSPACTPSITKTRRLKFRTSSAHQDQPENVKTIQAVDLQEKAQAPEIFKEPLDKEGESVLKVSECKPTKEQPEEQAKTKLMNKTVMAVKPEEIDKPQSDEPVKSILETPAKETTSTDNSLTENVCSSGPSEMEESSLNVTSPHTEETFLMKEATEMTLENRGPSITELTLGITENRKEARDSANVASAGAVVPETVPDTPQSSSTQEETPLKPYTESQTVDESKSTSVTEDCPMIVDETLENTEDASVSLMPILPGKQEPITVDETTQATVNIEEPPNISTSEDLRPVVNQEDTGLLTEAETIPTSSGTSALSSCSTESSNTTSELLQRSDSVSVRQTPEATVANKTSLDSEISPQDRAMDLEAPENNLVDQDLPINSDRENLTSPLTPIVQDTTVDEPVKITAAEDDIVDEPVKITAAEDNIVDEPVKITAAEDNIVDEPVKITAAEDNIVDEPVERTAAEDNIVDEPVKIIVAEDNIVNEPVKRTAAEDNIVDEPVERTAAEDNIVDEPVERTAAEDNIVDEPVKITAAEDNIVDEPVKITAAEDHIVDEPVERTAAEDDIVDEPVKITAAEDDIVDEPVKRTAAEDNIVDEPVKRTAAEDNIVDEPVKITAAEDNIVDEPVKRTAAEDDIVDEPVKITAAEDNIVDEPVKITAAEDNIVDEPVKITAAEDNIVDEPVKRTAAEDNIVDEPVKRTAAEDNIVDEPVKRTAAEDNIVDEPVKITAAEDDIVDEPVKIIVAEDNIVDEPVKIIVAEDNIVDEPVKRTAAETEDNIVDEPVKRTAAEDNIVDEPVKRTAAETEDSIADEPVKITAAETEDSIVDEPVKLTAAETEDSIADEPVKLTAAETEDSIADEPVKLTAAEMEDSIVDEPVKITAAETEDNIAKITEEGICEDLKSKECEGNLMDSEVVGIQPSEIAIDIQRSDVKMAKEDVQVIAQEEHEFEKELISEDHDDTSVEEQSEHIVSKGPPKHDPEEPEITQLPSPAQNEVDNKSVLQSTKEEEIASSQTNEGQVQTVAVRPSELKQPEAECPIDTAIVPDQILSPETGNLKTNEVIDLSGKAELQKDELVKLDYDSSSFPINPSPVHHTTDELLPNEDQHHEIEDIHEAAEAVEIRPRTASSSSSSSTSTSSSSSSSTSSSSSSSSRSTHSSTERSSHSRRSSRSKSSSPERQDQKSQSSRSSSPPSDKDQFCSESSETECSATLSSEVLPLERSQPLPRTSPPPPQTTVRLQRNTFNQGHSPSHPVHGERRRLHATYDNAEEQEQSKRIRLEPKSEDQDKKSPVPAEQEVGEEHSPGDINVVPEREDTVMDTVESLTEGEVQETAPSQPQEENCETNEKKESTTPPRPFKRKISVLSATKCSSQPSPVSTTNSDNEGAHPARRRRWGASTATTQRKPSISISTESLKSLIPEIKEIKQEAVVDLHAEDAHISDEESERNGDDNSHDKELKICRTVTQVVPAEIQENGQEEEDEVVYQNQSEEVPISVQEPAPMEIEPPPPSEQEVKKPLPESPAQAEVRVTLGDTLLRRSISQQKTGVSITIDDPVRTASQQPSPPRRKPSCIVHICNLVRPFTLGQLKELLARTGTIVEETFWIDKIKSHCYATYSTVEEAVSTRNSLHGVRWPQSNPKFLSVDFAEQDELDFHRGLLAERPPDPKPEEPPHQHSHSHTHTHAPPLRGEHREHERGAREQWAEREREMERRERTRSEREWDRDKIREGPRSRSRDRRRKEHAKSKEKKNEKKEKVQEEPPAKLLDDLFHKTKAAPCIYWLPLTDDQIVKKVADRAERAKEREKRRKEQEEQEEEERKERAKEREKEVERNRERAREAEREKRREHSREHPRERERRDPKRHSRSRSRSTPARDRGGRR
ncbi:apoptotic chromatin condensation inducer in the nucleus isoform X2 [Rhinoderma darwinii]|uniref:apoptotic chromatin condensation inducer in the nucleus isoform X2 n=1 Tax=Rhinoderma darwinii TaxID=43563 RepID=UPI003F666046